MKSVKTKAASSEKKEESNLESLRKRIVGINTEVPLLDGNKKQYIYLDNAASTPVLDSVLKTINDFMPWYSSVHRGSGFKSKIATEAYEHAREAILDFFGANPKEHVAIFGKNTTEAINKLSYRLDFNKDDVVLVGLLEHHSNDLPWRKMAEVHHIKVDKQGRILQSDLEELLKKYQGRVKLVAISGGSNVTGCVTDIHAFARLAHAAGAQILVDCAQLAPHRRVDVKKLGDPAHLDYISISAHKMYAPFGTGVLIGRRDTFETGAPELRGGGTIKVVTTENVEWAAPPDREEAGSPNVVGAVAFAKALKCLDEIGMDSVTKHEAELTAYTLKKLNNLPGLKIYGDTNPDTASKRLGVVPFNIIGVPHGLVAAILSAEWGIGVRDGCFCAHPYVTHLLGMSEEEVEEFSRQAVVNDRSHIPGMVRVSFGMYNTKEEIDILVDGVEQIIEGDYKGQYSQDKETGEYNPVGWQLNLPKYLSFE